MKNKKKAFLPAVGLAVAAAAVTAYMIAPGGYTQEQIRPFAGRNFAHRGLHRADKSVPENSLPAFEAAAAAGYGAELDVHLTADNELVVFHDDVLTRMCGVSGNLEDFTLEELQQLSLAHTEQTLPTLEQVLAAIDGKTPLIIELKRGHNNRLLCELAWETLQNYNGDFCIESFDPFILRWFRKNAPEILRGQLTCSVQKFGKDVNPVVAFVMSRGLTNFLSRPQFIAHDVGKKSVLIRLSEAMGAMKFCWTSKDWQYESENDAVIFEHYRPQPVFRKGPRRQQRSLLSAGLSLLRKLGTGKSV